MALADTASLIVDLNLRGNFGRNLGRISRDLNTFDTRLGKTESHAFRFGQQIGTGIRRSAALAAGGLAFLALNVQQGLDSLVDLEQQTAQTNAAIKSTGGIAGVTAAEVRRLAEQYESLNAVIGDEVIQSAENLLLTFTNIRKDAFEPALQAILDINQRMGGGPDGLAGVAQSVGRALNDPAKGLALLTRRGISFSAAQVKRIKALQEEGKLYEAQGVILGELNKRFGGSFLAGGGTTAARVAKFRDAIEDLQRTLASGLLPVVGNIADALDKLFRDPAFVTSVERFGKDLAGLFSSQNLAQGASVLRDFFREAKAAAPGIIQAARVAGQIVATAVRLFQSLPPDIQRIAIGAFAINKLTGGIITNVAGGVAGTVISEVLKRIVAGNVNVTGANVIVTGGGPAVGAAGGAAKTGLSGLSKVFLAGEAIGLAALVANVAQEQSAQNTAIAQQTHEIQKGFSAQRPTAQALQSAIAGVNQGIANLLSLRAQSPFGTSQLVEGQSLDELQAMRRDLTSQLAQVALTEQRQGEQTTGSISNEGAQTQSTVRSASAQNAATIAGAIRANRPNISVAVHVQATQVTKTVTIQERYGPGNGSYGGGH